MPPVIQFKPFEDIFSIPLRNGLTKPKGIRGKGIKMINMGELFAHPRINNVRTDRVPFTDKENSFLLEKGDLLFARQSLVLAGAGKCSIFIGDNEPVTYEGHIIRARLNSEISDPFFYYYFFNSPSGRQIIESIIEQVAAAGIRGSDLAKLNVPYPPFPEQRLIAGILGALDDKIELNRRMNATLESMARTVFRQWFVRNVDIDNWEVKTLGDILSVLETGSRPKGGVSLKPLGIPSVGAESIVKLGYFDFSKTKYVPVEFYESMRHGHVEDRDVLLYKDGGRPGEFEPHVSMFGDGFPFEKFSINEHVYRIKVSPPLTQAFFLLLARIR
jgi:restriction endonuclease S subunit